MKSKTQEDRHSDDLAVDRFAIAMKAKLAKSRQKGRGGWDDKTQCSGEHLASLLVEHLAKGNEGTFEDVANFAMMLYQRGERPDIITKKISENDQYVQELERSYEQLNLWLVGILAEYESTGHAGLNITQLRPHYEKMRNPIRKPHKDSILSGDLQREFGVRTEAELARLLEDRESRYAEEDPDDDEMIGNGVKISFVGGASKTTYNGKE